MRQGEQSARRNEFHGGRSPIHDTRVVCAASCLSHPNSRAIPCAAPQETRHRARNPTEPAALRLPAQVLPVTCSAAQPLQHLREPGTRHASGTNNSLPPPHLPANHLGQRAASGEARGAGKQRHPSVNSQPGLEMQWDILLQEMREGRRRSRSIPEAASVSCRVSFSCHPDKSGFQQHLRPVVKRI